MQALKGDKQVNEGLGDLAFRSIVLGAGWQSRARAGANISHGVEWGVMCYKFMYLCSLLTL